MNKKELIAHELGHAICATVQDSKYTPIDISLAKEDDMLGWCDFNYEFTPKKLKTKYAKHVGMSDLGGLFGELLYSGKWHPWGARSDLDSYIARNISFKNQELVKELDNWFYVDDDDLSYKACTKNPPNERKNFYLDPADTAERLPVLWEAYLEFCSLIDKKRFNGLVNEIFAEKIDRITKSKLEKYIEEVVKNGL